MSFSRLRHRPTHFNHIPQILLRVSYYHSLISLESYECRLYYSLKSLLNCTFECYTGTIPIWRNPSFVEYFAGHNLRSIVTSDEESTELSTPWTSLETSLILVTECLEHLLENESELPNLWKVHDAVKTASEMIVRGVVFEREAREF